MENRPSTWLVANRASGSNDEAVVAGIVEALANAGHSPGRIVSLPDDGLPDRAELEAAGVGLLVVFTGDGTINAAATRLYGWGGQVLALPGGTQNLFAKSCHGDAPAFEIIDRLAAGALAPDQRRLVRCSRGDALCEVLAGPGAAWSDVREAMREGDVGGVATTVKDAIGQSAAGPMVAVARPPLGKPEGYPAVRLYPRGDAMGVDGYGAEGLVDYAKQGLALLRRDFREGPHDELGAHREVVCRSEAPIELMIDGERATGGTEERFTLHHCDIAFLASAGHRTGA